MPFCGNGKSKTRHQTWDAGQPPQLPDRIGPDQLRQLPLDAATANPYARRHQDIARFVMAQKKTSRWSAKSTNTALLTAHLDPRSRKKPVRQSRTGLKT
jgi:hypothetical protein